MKNETVEKGAASQPQKDSLSRVMGVLDCLQKIKALRAKGDNEFVVSLRDIFTETNGQIQSKNQADTILYKIRDEGGGINVEAVRDPSEIGSPVAYVISIKNDKAFKNYFARIDNELQSLGGINKIQFSYNPESGDGEHSGTPTKRLKDGSPARKLFDAAYRNRRYKVARATIISILGLEAETNNTDIELTKVLSALRDNSGHRKNRREIQNTSNINSAVKEARERLRLNTYQLVNNGGNITLTI